MQIIPWSTEPNFEMTIAINNRNYVFSSYYNIRDESWYVDIANNDGVKLLEGKRVVLYSNLLRGVVDELSSEGVLMAINTAKIVNEITRDNMGIDINLFFITRDELNEIL